MRNLVLGLTLRPAARTAPTHSQTQGAVVAVDDPFEILGLEPTMEVERATLETRYLRLSRAAHPDHNMASEASLADAVARSAAINEAYRIVRDPWRRAEALIERAEPGCLDRTKTLSPTFLMEAMELAESVELAAREDGSRRQLQTRLEADAADYLDQLRAALLRSDHETAARKLHEARYIRKSLRDLDDPR